VFSRQKDVKVIVDRRKAEIQWENVPASPDRPFVEKRRPQENILEVAISSK
jgi:hypothetical protein